MRKLVPSGGNDKVYTPKNLAKTIIDHIQPKGLILEPCRGGGAFFDLLPNAEWCEIDQGRDFLESKFNVKFDYVITNPPWSKFRPFLQKSMLISNKIVFLATLNHFMTKARLRDIFNEGFGFKEIILHETPKEFPQSGFQLVTVVLEKDFIGPTTWLRL